MARPKNVLYAQSGGVTAVINASACGVIEAARAAKGKIGKLYAARNGIVGALDEDLIDTSKESARAVAALKHTPGGAFGSARFKLKSIEEDRSQYERLIDVFELVQKGIAHVVDRPARRQEVDSESLGYTREMRADLRWIRDEELGGQLVAIECEQEPMIQAQERNRAVIFILEISELGAKRGGVAGFQCSGEIAPGLHHELGVAQPYIRIVRQGYVYGASQCPAVYLSFDSSD